MIYIFSACQNICSLPGYLCSACSEGCKSCPGACKAVTEPMRSCCRNCGGNFRQFMERPLSGYAVLSVLVSAYALYSATGDMSAAPEKPAVHANSTSTPTAKSCTSNFLYIIIGFSLVNVCFAFYMQWQVWRRVMSQSAEFIDGDSPQEAYKGAFGRAQSWIEQQKPDAAPLEAKPKETYAAAPGKIIVPKEVVFSAFKTVFMEDFGVLAMFFGLLGMAVLSHQGPELVDAPKNACKVSAGTQDVGYGFFFLAFFWSFLYMCCGCCAKSVTINKPTEEDIADYEEVRN